MAIGIKSIINSGLHQYHLRQKNSRLDGRENAEKMGFKALAGGRRRVRTQVMPATVHGDVQSNSDQRKFITLKVGSNGHVRYAKVYLRTKDAKLARKRASVLDAITDPAEARRLIAYLDSSRTPEQEQRRIAELTKNTPTISAVTEQQSSRELEELLADALGHKPDPIDDEILECWHRASSPSAWEPILLSLGVEKNWLRDNPDVWVKIASRGITINPDFSPRSAAIAAAFGYSPDSLPPDRPARGPRLSACKQEFQKDQEQRATTKKHTASCLKKFDTFSQFLQDKPISRLNKADFVKYADHVIQNAGTLSNKTVRDRLKAVEIVLDAARARMDDGVFPDALDNWLGIFKRDRRKRPYKSPRQNREPMPPGLFKKLLAKADEWAGIDPEAYAKNMPVDDGGDKRKGALLRANNVIYAQNLHRIGLMAHSMLCLAANVGSQAIDFARLVWNELVLDGSLPVYREDRSKPAHLLGSEVPRCCPLLPETVRSLRRWQQFRVGEVARRHAAGADPHSQFVYTTSDLTPFNQRDGSGISKLLRRVRDEVDAGQWHVRHLRNIGSSLRRDHHLPEAMADAWLGHSAHGTNKLYTGEAKDGYLLPLTQAIRNTYFC